MDCHETVIADHPNHLHPLTNFRTWNDVGVQILTNSLTRFLPQPSFRKKKTWNLGDQNESSYLSQPSFLWLPMVILKICGCIIGSVPLYVNRTTNYCNTLKLREVVTKKTLAYGKKIASVMEWQSCSSLGFGGEYLSRNHQTVDMLTFQQDFQTLKERFWSGTKQIDSLPSRCQKC